MFKPFSLSKAINNRQTAEINQLKINALRSDLQKTRDLRQIASSSTVPTYSRTDGPPAPNGTTPQIQTGEQYDPEFHRKALQDAGYTDEAAKLTDQIGKQKKIEREEATYKAEEIAQLIYSAKGNPELWDQNFQIGVSKGLFKEEEYIPYSDNDWQRLMNDATEAKDLLEAEDGVSSGTSEFERHIQRMIRVGEITTERGMELIKKRAGTMAGLEQSEQQRLALIDKRIARKTKETGRLFDDATKGVEHFQKQRTAINDAIGALESGNNALADTMVTQVMSQIVDSKVRAYQMYAEYDRSYGNIAKRTYNAVAGFVGGARTPEDRKTIKETLLQFKKYADPAAKLVRNRYRALAKDKGLDPFQVVPPDSPEDVRDAPNISLEERKRILKLYFPDMFKKGNK